MSLHHAWTIVHTHSAGGHSMSAGCTICPDLVYKILFKTILFKFLPSYEINIVQTTIDWSK